MIESVTLLGSSSGRNAGDAALIAGIMESIDAATGRSLTYEVPTIKPDFVRTSYRQRVRPISMLPWSLSLKMLGLPTYHSILRTNLSLVFDAILFDRSLYNPLFNYLSSIYLMLPRAKKLGKKLGWYDVGVGPATSRHGREMLRVLAEETDFITVRDQESYDLLRDIGVQNPRMLITSDAALNVTASPKDQVDQIMQSLGFSPGEEILGININRYLDTWAGHGGKSMGKERFLAEYASALTRVVRRLQVPLLFVVTQHHDLAVTQELMARVETTRPCKLISNIEHSFYDVKGVLGRLSMLFGMRLHSQILASSELTPIIGLAFQPKVTSYYRTLGMEDSVMTFKNFTADYIERHILTGWERRHELRAQLMSRIPVLRTKANIAAELVAALSRNEDLDSAVARLQNSVAPRAQVA